MVILSNVSGVTSKKNIEINQAFRSLSFEMDGLFGNETISVRIERLKGSPLHLFRGDNLLNLCYGLQAQNSVFTLSNTASRVQLPLTTGAGNIPINPGDSVYVSIENMNATKEYSVRIIQGVGTSQRVIQAKQQTIGSDVSQKVFTGDSFSATVVKGIDSVDVTYSDGTVSSYSAEELDFLYEENIGVSSIDNTGLVQTFPTTVHQLNTSVIKSFKVFTPADSAYTVTQFRQV